MHEFDKISMMHGIENIMENYAAIKAHMADVVDNPRVMTPAHAGMIELASYHMARAAGEFEKLLQDWRMINGKESDK